MNIIIDTEFQGQIVPLTESEKALLEADIVEHGCREPLVLWRHNGQNIVVDGHHRYEICNRLELSYETTEYEFEDRLAATKYIYDNQLGRRNLTDEYRTYILGARYELEKTPGHGTKSVYNNCTQNTRQRLADENSVSEQTVINAAKYKQSIDAIAAHSEEVKDAILRGETGANKQDILQYGAVQRDSPNLGKCAVDELLAGNVDSFRHAIYKANHQLIHQSKSNEWYTPIEYIDAARRVMGSIDLDPASNEYANTKIMAEEYYTKEEDGLSMEWYGNIWLNPPYGKASGEGSNQAVWSARLIEEYQQGNINQAILLVNAVPGNLWFYPLWDYVICFPRQRIKFYNKKGSTPAPTHGNALVYFGNAVKLFKNEFEVFGAVVCRMATTDE